MSHCWQNILIGLSSTIRDALKIIDNEALRVAMIVDEESNLLGVVTDGDIRRGLLQNFTLETGVEKVMITSPITADVNTPMSRLVEIMEEKDILAIPLLDKGKVVGLETLHDALVSRPVYKNPVFLMAGGLGKRLRPLTDNCPKPMLKVGGKPILETVIKRFIKSGFINFYISTHYMPEQIEEYFGNGSELGVSIKYVHEEEPLGTGGALGLLPKDILDDLSIVMMNGDLLTKVDFERLLEFHNNQDAHATMCVREYEYQIPYGVIDGEGGQIRSMVEKPIQRFFINAGIYVVSPELAKSVPVGYKIDMPTLLEREMSATTPIMMFPIHEYWLDIGRMDDFNRAQTDIQLIELD